MASKQPKHILNVCLETKKIGTKKSFFMILQMLTVMVLAIIIQSLKCRLLPTSNFWFQCLSSHFWVTRYFQFRIIFEIHLLGLGGGSTSFIYSKRKKKRKKKDSQFFFKTILHLSEWCQPTHLIFSSVKSIWKSEEKSKSKSLTYFKLEEEKYYFFPFKMLLTQNL